MALLERHAAAPSRPTLGDWLFVSGILAAIAALVVIPLLILMWALRALADLRG
jgi:hypothetical protein